VTFPTRRITTEQLADMLFEEWENQNISQEAHDKILEGYIPKILLLRNQMKLAIESAGEEGYFNVTQF